jgi:DNA-binding MarR family transcriptional regulator
VEYFVVKQRSAFRALFPSEKHADDRWCAYAAKVARDRDPEPPVKLGTVLDFMRLLWKMNHELESLSKRLVAVAGVTGPQRLVVRIVGRSPDIAAGTLAGILHMHPSTLTGILERLVRRGLLTRERDPADGRRVLVALTARGRRTDTMRRGTVEAAVGRALRRFSDAQLAAAEEVLGAVAESLAAESKIEA